MSLDRTTPPPVSTFADISLAPERVEHLANGIDLHIVEGGDQPVSRLSIFSDGGLLDMPDRAAASVACEAMRECTASLSGEQIADIIDFNGARLGSRLTEHYTGIDLLALNSRMPEVLPVVRDIATAAVFTPQTVRTVASKAASARALQLTKVSVLADEAARDAIAGPGHPATLTPTPAMLADVSVDDCTEWYAGYLTRRRHAFLGGNFDHATLDTVRRMLESLPATTSDPIVVQPYRPTAPCHRDIVVEGACQAAVVMAMPTVGRDNPDYIALRLTVMALGGYFGSRLMSNIREDKGLTYGINAALLGNREGACMEIQAQCDARYVDRVIEETMHEIDDLRSNPPCGAELDRLRLFAWTSLANAADTAIGTLDHYITQMLVATPPDYFERQLAVLRTLSPDTIADMAAKYLHTDNILTVVAGDHA